MIIGIVSDLHKENLFIGPDLVLDDAPWQVIQQFLCLR